VDEAMELSDEEGSSEAEPDAPSAPRWVSAAQSRGLADSLGTMAEAGETTSGSDSDGGARRRRSPVLGQGGADGGGDDAGSGGGRWPWGEDDASSNGSGGFDESDYGYAGGVRLPTAPRWVSAAQSRGLADSLPSPTVAAAGTDAGRVATAREAAKGAAVAFGLVRPHPAVRAANPPAFTAPPGGTSRRCTLVAEAALTPGRTGAGEPQ
jgi:hypothetical protein